MARPVGCADRAVERLLFRYPNSLHNLNDFDNYVRDVALVSSHNIPPQTLQEARAVFLQRLQRTEGDTRLKHTPQKARQRKAISSDRLLYWIFDIIVLINIVSGFTFLYVKKNFKITAGNNSFANEPFQVPSEVPQEGNNEAMGAQERNGCPPPIKHQLYKVQDIVDVLDPTISTPFRIPWEIKDIHSNNDGTLKFHLQRSIAGRKTLMVLENASAQSMTKSESFEPNTKAMCEIQLELLPCTVLKKVLSNKPGGDLYQITIQDKDGKVHNTYRPYLNIWRIPNGISDDDPALSPSTHPLAEDMHGY